MTATRADFSTNVPLYVLMACLNTLKAKARRYVMA